MPLSYIIFMIALLAVQQQCLNLHFPSSLIHVALGRSLTKGLRKMCQSVKVADCHEVLQQCLLTKSAEFLSDHSSVPVSIPLVSFGNMVGYACSITSVPYWCPRQSMSSVTSTCQSPKRKWPENDALSSVELRGDFERIPPCDFNPSTFLRSLRTDASSH